MGKKRLKDVIAQGELSTPHSEQAPPHEIELLRAAEYRLLSRLLIAAPDAATLGALSMLGGDESALGAARVELAAFARRADVATLDREFFTLFVGVGRGELLPYASYYQTGFLNERPLADLRRDLRLLGIERVAGLHDPEDHIAILCDVMCALAGGGIAEGPVGERDFFRRHIEPWAERFFGDLATAPSATFYGSVGRLGATFMAIESKAFALEDDEHSSVFDRGTAGPGPAGTQSGRRAESPEARDQARRKPGS